MTKSEIFEWIKMHSVGPFMPSKLTVDDQGRAIITQDLQLSRGLSGIPFEIAKCNFIGIEQNEFKSLDWLPEKVLGSVIAWDNQIDTLRGGPKHVLGSYDVDNNPLNNLEGSPELVSGSFIVSACKLNTLKGCEHTKVGNTFKAVGCGLRHIDALPMQVANLDLSENSIDDVSHLHELVEFYQGSSSDGGGTLHLRKNQGELKGLFYLAAIEGIQRVSIGSSNDTKLVKAVRLINDFLQGTEGPKTLIDLQNKFIDAGLDEYL